MNNNANIEVPNIKCPFLIGVTRMSISCEGIESSKNVMWFESEEIKRSYLESRCYEYPNKCPIAKLLEAKYEESM